MTTSRILLALMLTTGCGPSAPSIGGSGGGDIGTVEDESSSGDPDDGSTSTTGEQESSSGEVDSSSDSGSEGSSGSSGGDSSSGGSMSDESTGEPKCLWAAPGVCVCGDDPTPAPPEFCACEVVEAECFCDGEPTAPYQDPSGLCWCGDTSFLCE